MSLLSISLILFLIMDPFGNVAYFLNVLSNVPAKQQRWVIVREMFIALGLMIAFYFIGDWILDLLNLSEATVSLTSGIILFLVSIKIIFPSPSYTRVQLRLDTDPFIVPLAIPLIAGPALLATVMLFSHMQGIIVLPAIFIAWITASLVLISSRILMKYLGSNGLLALERLMGLVLILLAIQRFMEGVTLFIEKIPGA